MPKTAVLPNFKAHQLGLAVGRVVFYFFFNILDGYRSKVAHG